jgi:hypothetical protein
MGRLTIGVTLRNPKDNKLLYLYTWFAF